MGTRKGYHRSVPAIPALLPEDAASYHALNPQAG